MFEPDAYGACVKVSSSPLNLCELSVMRLGFEIHATGRIVEGIIVVTLILILELFFGIAFRESLPKAVDCFIRRSYSDVIHVHRINKDEAVLEEN